jgi:hypothetical protein
MKMKLFRTFLSLLVISLGIISCAETQGTAKPKGGISENVSLSKTYSAPHDKVWQAACVVLNEWGYVYETNLSNSSIKTEPKQLNYPKGGVVNWLAQPRVYFAKLYINTDGSKVSIRAEVDSPGYTDIQGRKDLEYPEKENELGKNFFEALNAKLGGSAMQIDKKQVSEIKEQPVQPASKVQLQSEAKEAKFSAPTIAIVRKAKKEQGLNGYIFQDQNSKKFFLEDSDGNTYKFAGTQWIKIK